jgi:RHS repeat-associated protein
MSYQYGILHHIYDFANPATLWWRVDGVNPAGQVTHESMQYAASDPLVVQYHTYDAVTGWVSSIQGGANGGTGLQNESYLYDEMGNVTQRQNNNIGLTENFYYDNLYRLDHSTLGGTTNLQMQYDAMGDITSRSDIAGGATWTYDATHKHQVTQAGSSAYSYLYDGNGNARNRNGTLIGWTSYNYPSSVGTSTESATFDYGADRQRWRMIYSSPSGTETTYYATPRFEVVATSAGMDYRHYIYANGRPVVVVSHTSAGAVNASSLFTDHQGSISSIIASATTTNVASESFTAYGNRREASTWSGSPTSSELSLMNGITREGYTFQTVLGSMGLNHMNGRVQDAVTGRFLSPDPSPAGRGNTQSWNRYSYANNNPISFTDPSGFKRCSICTEKQSYGDTAHNFVTAPYGEAPISDGAFAGMTFDVNDPLNLDNYFGTSSGSGTATVGPLPAGNPAPSDPAPSSGVDSAAAQSQTPQGGGTTVWNDPNDASAGVIACGNCAAGSAAGTVSATAGWAGIGTGLGDYSSGTTAIGTNGRFYSAPRGNQYFRTLTKLDTVFKVTGVVALGVGTAADFYDAINGDGSYGQAGFNLGIGVAGVLSPLYFVPGSIYFATSTLYPGGPAAYNAAYSQQLNAAEGGGP